ncbi:PilC/PilY family type IV pilus protein [Glaciecola sp. SC05]|uniref:PilC/PilY family type IV pilus protein n=1 Tax=Glaciecola sp. SC05 TaxID=1987355 RepID=UPI0035283E0B
MSCKKFGVATSAFLLSFMVSFSAFGDDLEIYLGTNNSQFTYKPNVLFIMDTSGSMSAKDGTQFSRMQRVQQALNQALSDATNINAGLMRFSDNGGPILYPVTDIDKPLPPEIILNTQSSRDDAYEIDNNVNLSTNELILTQGTKTVSTGLRFADVNIPQGAIITKAVLRLTSSMMNTSNSVLTIRGESTGDGSEFGNSWKNISQRTPTAEELVWDQNNAFPLDDDTILSPDFSNVLQEIVDHGDWCGGNAVNLLIEGKSNSGSSSRRAYSNDMGDSRAPQLIITYDESNATGCIAGSQTFQVLAQTDNAEEDNNGRYNTLNQLNFQNNSNNYIGLRFQSLNIPKGATIKNAWLEFTAATSRGNNNSKMTIHGVAEPNPPQFDSQATDALKNKPKTAASVSWNNIGYWSRESRYNSPDIKGIIEEIVNLPGWQPRNSIMFSISNFQNSNSIAAYSHQGKPSAAPRLFVEFEGNASPGNSSTVRDYLISRVNELSTSGFTPIVDTLYEAARYYGGMSVDYGLKRGESNVSSSVRRSTRVSHRESYVGIDANRPAGCTDLDLSSGNCINEFIPAGATYISPVQNLQCQVNNHIVLLSDGQANNNHSVGKIQALLGKNCQNDSSGDKCGIDLVTNLKDPTTSVIGPRVKTHTIGFAANSTANNFLNQLATNGGGDFYTADNSADLLAAFKTILSSVQDVNTTFVSPGVAVNQLNRLTHRDELYFALFRPEEGTLWPGNLKKYKISGDTVLDSRGFPAVDSSTGFFDTNAKSYWSLNIDGNDVRKGGAISKLDLVRNIYTFGANPGSIMVAGNKFEEGNSAITESDLALTQVVDPAQTRENVLKWARGVDLFDADGDGSTTDINYMMGDPIHSQPVIVNYTATDSEVFVATNQGFLHSFDATTGEENFAIIPRDLLANLHEFYQNNSSFNHVYGLDGDMVYREANGKRYLYIGMRRGGNNYYVLDITTRNNPKLVFQIDGGNGDFSNLGQTWSRPIITKINVGGTEKDVMIIGGGYDENQDGKKSRSPDIVGNSVYIIDANNGNLLWEASRTNADLNLPEMEYSIPARISVIDRNNDGLADHMYVADMGGQLFRLDIYNGNPTSTLVKGKLMAKLGGAAESENRRFYYGPDVSEVVMGDEHYYAVAIGSGFRAGPLNTTINDNFYMIKDKGVFERNANNEYKHPATPFELNNLYDATDHLLTSADQTQRDLATQTFANKDGWYIRLTTGGEKVLAAPLILDYQVFFTTYVPASSSLSLCAPPTGNSRAYLVNLFNGNSVTDLNQNNTRENDDRFAELSQTGIAPDTKILIEDISKPVVCLGAECVSAVIEVDQNGNNVACGSQFECLAQNIYGRFERVQKDTWRTEVERN